MADFPFSSITIPDDIKPSDTPKYLRQLQAAFAASLATIQRQSQGDPARGWAKDAKQQGVIDLYAQEGPVSLRTANRPTAGDVLYASDSLNAVWGTPATPAPTDSGSGPLFGGNNALLDGSHHTDTVAAAVARGALPYGNTTPKWDKLVIGAAGKFLGSDGTDLAWRNLSMASVSLTNQGAAIVATNLLAAPVAGLYEVSYYLEDTTADITAGTVQFKVNHTDHVGARTQVEATPLALTATGRDQGAFVVYVASGVLSYQVDLVGIFGTAKYALTVRVVALG